MERENEKAMFAEMNQQGNEIRGTGRRTKITLSKKDKGELDKHIFDNLDTDSEVGDMLFGQTLRYQQDQDGLMGLVNTLTDNKLNVVRNYISDMYRKELKGEYHYHMVDGEGYYGNGDYGYTDTEIIRTILKNKVGSDIKEFKDILASRLYDDIQFTKNVKGDLYLYYKDADSRKERRKKLSSDNLKMLKNIFGSDYDEILRRNTIKWG